ncbi:MAG: hypothetical protein U0746_15615 [Gemmataceae bacterium]
MTRLVRFACGSFGCLLATMVVAADPPAPAQPAAPAVSGKLNHERLGEVLRNFGYEPTISKSDDGTVNWYRIDIDQGDFKFVTFLCVLANEEKVRILLPLGNVAEPSKVPAERLWKLLEENGNIAPMAFYYNTVFKQFQLNHYIENRDLTPAKLRKELDATLRVTKRTYSVWDTSKWPGGPAPAPTAPATDKGETAKKGGP